MHDVGRVLRVEARHSTLLGAVPVLAAGGAVLAWRALPPGVAYWDAAVVALTASVRLLGPVAAALAAWASLREHRFDYLRGLTSRSPATGALLDLLLLCGAALVAYGLAATVIAVGTVARDEAGRLHPLGVPAGAAALVLHVVLGYLAARLVPHPMTAALTGGLTALWAALRAGTSWWSLLPPATLDHVDPFTGLRTGVLADQLLWSLGAAAALVCGYVAVVARRPVAVTLAVAALAVTAVSTVRLEASGGTAVSPAPAGRRCVHWPLTICVHPALRSALPALEAALTPLAARLAGTPGAFTRVEQRPPGEPVGVRNGVAYIHLPDLAPGYEQRVVRALVAGLAEAAGCADPRRARGAAYTAVVDAWLLDDPVPATGRAVGAEFARFGDWTETRRRHWLSRNFAAYRSCTLQPHDLR